MADYSESALFLWKLPARVNHLYLFIKQAIGLQSAPRLRFSPMARAAPETLKQTRNGTPERRLTSSRLSPGGMTRYYQIFRASLGRYPRKPRATGHCAALARFAILTSYPVVLF